MDTPQLTLNKLAIGTCAKIISVQGETSFRRRLLELGLIPGVRVQVSRVAPLGDPIEVIVRDTRLSLRKKDAASIVVNPEQLSKPCNCRKRHHRIHCDHQGGFSIAIAGNPNTGKTTIFNALTNAHAQVGNYPGITVERITGKMELPGGGKAKLVDVPGAYSLTARSREEQVAIDEILGRGQHAAPDLVVVVLNASALERSHYLLLQIQEFGIPIVAAVNMMDEARQQGIYIDVQGMSNHLGIPIVGVVGKTGEGLYELKLEIEKMLAGPLPHQVQAWHWQPSDDLAVHLDDIAQNIDEKMVPAGTPSLRKRALALWCLMSLHGQDELEGIPQSLREKTLQVKQEMIDHGHDLDMEVVSARYAHIDHDLPAFIHKRTDLHVSSFTEKLDRIVTHPIAGGLLFFAVMTFVFTALFDWTAPVMEGIESAFGYLSVGLRAILPTGFFADALIDGVLAGVGAVLVFLPQILLLFLFITFLEGTGYLARVAFLFDRVMKRIGLHGRAFIPLVSGFACAVPAIMATRTIESKRDRILTIMVLPLISCPARLPVYVLVIGVLYPANEKFIGPFSYGTVLMLIIYGLSTLLTIVAGYVLGKTVLKGKPQPLLLELPPYRLPTLQTYWVVLKQKTKVFVKTAGTVIVLASLILWVLLTYPAHVDYSENYPHLIEQAEKHGDKQYAIVLADQMRSEQLQQSYAGRIGRFLEPAIKPLGFDWKIGIGLIGAFAAREVFVATMGLVYGIGNDGGDATSLQAAMKKERRADGSLLYSPLTGIALLVFFMIALQCISTIAVVRQETASWKWTLFQLGYISTLAYVATLCVYQGGKLLGL